MPISKTWAWEEKQIEIEGDSKEGRKSNGKTGMSVGSGRLEGD